MKKLLLILCLSLPMTLAAQDQIVIPKGQDTLFRVMVTDWYALDPIQTKDGNFILPAKILKDLGDFTVKMEAAPVTIEGKVIKTELEKLPVKDIKEIELKEAEVLEKEPIR